MRLSCYHDEFRITVHPPTTLTMLWRNSLSVTGQTHEKLTSICFFTITNCQIVRCSSLTHRINDYFFRVSASWLTMKISQWARENFCSYSKNQKDWTRTITFLKPFGTTLIFACLSKNAAKRIKVSLTTPVKIAQLNIVSDDGQENRCWVFCCWQISIKCPCMCVCIEACHISSSWVA